MLVTILVVPGAAIAYGYAAFRWGCPSNAELMKPRSVDEVSDAFREAGYRLTHRRTLPQIEVFRHSVEGAAIWAFICRRACNARRQVEAVGPIVYSVVLTNVVVAISATDTAVGQQLVSALTPIVDRLDRGSKPGDRCYVG
jgi:hypothetical protein